MIKDGAGDGLARAAIFRAPFAIDTRQFDQHRKLYGTFGDGIR
jgi:hypothetical protein